MTDPVPRMRMFAGPNGSGKSTLKKVLPERLLGVYLNPDEIEKRLRATGVWDFSSYGVSLDDQEACDFFASSSFLRAKGLGEEAKLVRCKDARLDFTGVSVNAYVASVAADLFRRKLIESQKPFTFETVMSHRSKIDLLRYANNAGFRTYLYYVATETPEINVSRVSNRVARGGHSVPEDKIVARYDRSLELLIEAIKQTDRAYLFDNSGDNEKEEQAWLAEVTDGCLLKLQSADIPNWFRRYVLRHADPFEG